MMSLLEMNQKKRVIKYFKSFIKNQMYMVDPYYYYIVYHGEAVVGSIARLTKI